MKDVFGIKMGKSNKITGNKTCKIVYCTLFHVLFPVISLLTSIYFIIMSKNPLSDHITIETLVFEFSPKELVQASGQ